MRIVLVAMFAACCMLGSPSLAPAGTYASDGSYQGSPSSVVTRLFAANRAGGEGLVAALRELLINDPSLADDVAYAAARGNAAQQSATADAMAQALIVLTSRGNTFGAGKLVTAAQFSGIAVIQQAVLSAVATAVGSNGYQEIKSPQTAANCTTTTTPADRTVSPTKPATTTTTCQ